MKDDRQKDPGLSLSSVVLFNEQRIPKISTVEFFVGIHVAENDNSNLYHVWYITSFVNNSILLQTKMQLYHLTDAFEYHLREIKKLDFLKFDMFAEHLIQYDNSNRKYYSELATPSNRTKPKGHYFWNKIMTSAYNQEDLMELKSIQDDRLSNYIDSIIVPSEKSIWRHEQFYLQTFLNQIKYE